LPVLPRKAMLEGSHTGNFAAHVEHTLWEALRLCRVDDLCAVSGQASTLGMSSISRMLPSDCFMARVAYMPG
jgi:hypothetical protein